MPIRTDPVDCGWYLRWFEGDGVQIGCDCGWCLRWFEGARVSIRQLGFRVGWGFNGEVAIAEGCGDLQWEFDFAGETVLKDELPMFPNLKHLKLNGDAENYWNNLLLPFLNCSPVLETLEFAEGLARNHGDTIGEDGRMALEREFFTSDQEIPLCCRYHLKRILIKKKILWIRTGRSNYPVSPRHALVLEELVICLARNPNPIQDQMSVEDTLKNMPRASVTCSIQVL